MKSNKFKARSSRLVALVLAGSSLLAMSGVASAAAATVTSSSSDKSSNSQQHLQNIITKGDQEITRRLTTLGKLDAKINGATRLSSTDKAALSAEVSSETANLTALKTKLDSETVLANAITDAKSIFTDYRVYALVVPKVNLVKTADDQQVVETKLSSLEGKLQTRLTAVQNSGKDVSSLQATLNDMSAKTTAAQAISAAIESKVIGLQPNDYNSDHTVLSGDRDQLVTAHNDNKAAFADAKTIVAGLKNL